MQNGALRLHWPRSHDLNPGDCRATRMLLCKYVCKSAALAKVARTARRHAATSTASHRQHNSSECVPEPIVRILRQARICTQPAKQKSHQTIHEHNSDATAARLQYNRFVADYCRTNLLVCPSCIRALARVYVQMRGRWRGLLIGGCGERQPLPVIAQLPAAATAVAARPEHG